MLSTPPAFNLSQNQTLQLKSLLPVPRPLGLNQLNSKLFSRFALHLSKNRRPLPQPRRFPSAAKRELTPPGSACQQLFFQTAKFFFEARPEEFSPAHKRALIPTPSRCQQLFSVFSKNFLPCRARPPGPARLNGTLCPAAARTGYAPLRDSCQRLFIFFLIFLTGNTRFSCVFAQVWI